MRQAGRYMPEYRELRKKYTLLELCKTPELAAEVTHQPLVMGMDAAILFADILLLPQALGPKLWFEPGEGPRMDPTTTPAHVARLKPTQAIHDTLAPIYQTLRILTRELPRQTTLIGFAGAPWTVATYMIAGRGSKDQAAAHRLKATDRPTFQSLIDRITDATIEYLSAQITAGAEVVKLFDSWAGSLHGQDFTDFAVTPTARIIAALKARHPTTPIIAFPREAGPNYQGFARATGADCVALDNSVDPTWAAQHVQPDSCVQGNLAPHHLATGGPALTQATRHIVETFAHGPHIFNLGHGITPDANPDHVQQMIDTVRAG